MGPGQHPDACALTCTSGFSHTSRFRFGCTAHYCTSGFSCTSEVSPINGVSYIRGFSHIQADRVSHASRLNGSLIGRKLAGVRLVKPLAKQGHLSCHLQNHF